MYRLDLQSGPGASNLKIHIFYWNFSASDRRSLHPLANVLFVESAEYVHVTRTETQRCIRRMENDLAKFSIVQNIEMIAAKKKEKQKNRKFRMKCCSRFKCFAIFPPSLSLASAFVRQ